jgi:hypothetical protein
MFRTEATALPDLPLNMIYCADRNIQNILFDIKRKSPKTACEREQKKGTNP